jgi:hypothetical protein
MACPPRARSGGGSGYETVSHGHPSAAETWASAGHRRARRRASPAASAATSAVFRPSAPCSPLRRRRDPDQREGEPAAADRDARRRPKGRRRVAGAGRRVGLGPHPQRARRSRVRPDRASPSSTTINMPSQSDVLIPGERAWLRSLPRELCLRRLLCRGVAPPLPAQPVR